MEERIKALSLHLVDQAPTSVVQKSKNGCLRMFLIHIVGGPGKSERLLDAFGHRMVAIYAPNSPFGTVCEESHVEMIDQGRVYQMLERQARTKFMILRKDGDRRMTSPNLITVWITLPRDWIPCRNIRESNHARSEHWHSKFQWLILQKVHELPQNQANLKSR